MFYKFSKIVFFINLIVFFNLKAFSQTNKIKEREVKTKVIVDLYASANPFKLQKAMDYGYFIEIRPYSQGKNEGVYIVDYNQLILNGIIAKRANKTLRLPDIDFERNRAFLYIDSSHYKYKYKTSFVLNAKWVKYSFSYFEPSEANQKSMYFKIVGDTIGQFHYYILKDTISTKPLISKNRYK